MKRFPCWLALLAIVGVPASEAQAPKKTKTPRQFDEVKPTVTPFAIFRKNGMITALRNARAADVIATFYPMHPVVGRENLPDDRRFDIDIDPYEMTSDMVLTRLGKTLGLSLRDVETTTEFLIVRNETNPIPKGWVHVIEADLLDFGLMARGPHGITQIDPTDGYHTAYFTTMPEFAHFLNGYSAKPVWNQTALLGRYCFSFRLHGGNVNRTLADMGFDVVVREGTTRCIVVARAGK